MAKDRADRLLVSRGLFASRAAAQAAIEAGRVFANGVAVAKASQPLAEDARIDAEPAHPYVWRGGAKLSAALGAFHVDPAGKACLDVGASTGGFTDVLLRAGARLVYAVDVGTGQLHPSLVNRPDVVMLEKTDIRKLASTELSEPPGLAVVDVSFISLKLVLPAVTALVRPPAVLIALIKPQFEVGRLRLRKGVVRDPAARASACAEVAGVPLLAEPSSNARTGGSAIARYREHLRGELGHRIERVVVFGHPTLSRPMAALLERPDVELVVVSDGAAWGGTAADQGTVTIESISNARLVGTFSGTLAPIGPPARPPLVVTDGQFDVRRSP